MHWARPFNTHFQLLIPLFEHFFTLSKLPYTFIQRVIGFFHFFFHLLLLTRSEEAMGGDIAWEYLQRQCLVLTIAVMLWFLPAMS